MADSPAQLQHLINRNGDEISALNELIGDCQANDPMLPQLRWRVGMLENTRLDFARRYTRLTGTRPHYQYYLAPVKHVVSKQKAAALRKEGKAEEAKIDRREKTRLTDLVQRGEVTLHRVRGRLTTLYENGKSSSVASSWVNFFGGNSIRVLPAMRATLSETQQKLKDARAALQTNDFGTAQRLLTQAAAQLLRIEKNISHFDQTQVTGTSTAETVVGFYAAVTTAAVTGGGSLTVWQSIGVTAVGSTAQNGTDLALRAIDGKENLSSDDLWKAASAVGTDTAMAGAGAGFGKLAKAMAGPLSKRIAASAVEKYLTRGTPGFGTHRKEILKAVEKAVASRIANLSSAQLAHAVGKLKDGKKTPDWNAWQRVIGPLVGGNLQPVVEAAGKEAASK